MRRRSLLPALVLLTANAPTPLVAGPSDRPLALGPYAVGFHVELAVDASRPDGSSSGEDARSGMKGRRIQLALWYPASLSPDVAPDPAWRYLPLRDGVSTSADWSGERGDAWLARQIASWTAEGVARGAIDEVLLRSAAAIDAPAAAGRFPLLLFSPSMLGHPASNARMLEVLASRGYVVAAHPSFGFAPGYMTTSPADLDAQARDLQFLLGTLSGDERVDANRVAAFGHSWGGMAALLAAARDPRIRAVASLDGSEEMWRDVLEEAPGFAALAVDVPFLRLTNPPGVSRMSWEQFENLRAAPRVRATFREPIDHFEFVSSRLERAMLREPAAVPAIESHLGAVLHYLNSFFERALAAESPPVDGSAPADGGLALELRSPEVPGSSPARLLRLLEARGADAFLSRCRELLASAGADAARSSLTRVGEMLLWTGRHDETALALLHALNDRFPSDVLVLEMIGNVHLWNLGEPERAEPYYRQAILGAPRNRRLADYLAQIAIARPETSAPSLDSPGS